MKRTKLLHITWLIPVMLSVLLAQQLSVLTGIQLTYNQGEDLSATITDFRIKQIAAQTNGYVDLSFTSSSGERVDQRLSLHVQHASRLIGLNEVDIRYRAGATYDIVIVDTFEYHKNTVLINLAVIGLSLIVMIGVSIFASKYAAGKIKNARNDNIELEFQKS